MTITETFERVQRVLEEKGRTLGRGKYGRVLRMSRKPTPEEFSKSSWITAIGIALVGGLGFTIYYIWTYLPPWLGGLLGL